MLSSRPAPQSLQENTFGVTGEAQSLAGSLPDLLVEASRIAANVTAGWHGRRRSGPGETFWQFRPFLAGEAAHQVDWRRSARDDNLYVREREWEAAQTIWVWADLSASMHFQSKQAKSSKQTRALLLMLALSYALNEAGERVGLTGLTHALASRNAVQTIAETLVHENPSSTLPNPEGIRRFSETVLFSDLLDPPDKLEKWMETIASTGAKGHLVQLLDPIEESFPFTGPTRFEDPENGAQLKAGRAQTWQQEYLHRLAVHKDQIRSLARRFDWSYTLHHTNRPALEPLMLLHSRLANTPQHKMRGDKL
ncbi:hypothetical protein PsAD2_02757 [Pseudovibrio axinellae]|uniref:DUF58 domain-containing protein n=1 Tax=Pseudovibrio axinellae TaxID=989403 RepID=A0A165XTI7_9HYPH|nr:DUF58 domain-containing protein [Pseudovibrio axinellae]KZL18023.1 hypothetical protein PsAD2_02757 [Pseudovibrio axinellae]SER13156.1 Protein of unknown function DUF58 [Pseudovibrio axinellae]